MTSSASSGFGESWSAGPDPDVRSSKSQVEEELLIKLGAKKEAVEFHPLILSSRLERAKSYVGLRYSRAKPPAVELSKMSRNSWTCQDQALRQISNAPRRGPRDFLLPALTRSPSRVQTLDVPLTDLDYHLRRADAIKRLTNYLNEWTVLHRRAFPVSPQSRQSTRGDLEVNRKLSRGTLIHLTQGQPGRKPSLNGLEDWVRARKISEAVPRSRQKKNRWRDMAQEVLLNMKSVQMRLPQELPRSELRIYVSSTPDLQEERDFLQEVAYPKLLELCETLGLNCHIVDMRNGAGFLNNDLETFDLIELELQNCRRLSMGPYFVSLIGHELDDQGLPGFLYKNVYEAIRETLIRENIIGVEEFDDMYRLDSNRVPPVYIKQHMTEVKDYVSPEAAENILFRALSQAVAVIQAQPQADQYTGVDFYKWSAVVKEVEEGLLRCFSPRSDTLCFMMDAVSANSPETKSPINRLRQNVYHHYKQFASRENLVNFKSGRKTISYLRSLADTFISGVASLLKFQMRHREYDITQQLTEGSEALQHVRIALEQAKRNLDNEEMVGRIKDSMNRDTGFPKTILLWGPSGLGKTSIVSQVAKASVLWDPRRKVVFRCLGTTLRSCSLFRVLESLIKQLNFIYSLEIVLPIDITLKEVVSVFCYTLKAVSSKRTQHGDLLLILDQLDRLPDTDIHLVLCILNSLCEGTTLIITLQTPHHLMQLLKSHPIVQTMTRLYMTKQEVEEYLTNIMEACNRVITSDQLQDSLQALPHNIIPLYSQILFHMVKWWPSHTLPDLEPFTDSPESDFVLLLDSIEDALGKAFTKYALSYLATARHGLADDELLHLLSKDAELLDQIKAEEDPLISVVEGFPYQFQLSRLLTRLGKFTVEVKLEGETVYQISSQPLVESIKSKYMGDAFFYTVHHRLANFFLFIRRGLLLSSKEITEKKHKDLAKYHWRTLRCVQYHFCYSSEDPMDVWKGLKEKVFFNFAWLVNAVYSGFFNDLLDAITFALDTVSLDTDIQYLQKLLISVRHTVIHNPLSLAAVFASQNVDDANNVKDNVSVVVEEARLWLKQVHLQALVPVSYTLGKTSRLLVKDNSIYNVTDLLAMSGTGTLIVQRDKTLFTHNMLTSEEVLLATLTYNVVAIYLCSEDCAAVLTTGLSTSYHLELYSLQKSKHLKSVSLGDLPIHWLEFKSSSIAYFANDAGIASVNVDRDILTNIKSPKTPWDESCLSASRSDKAIVLTIGEETTIESFPVKNISQFKFISLKNETSNEHCKPLLSTKDGKYIVYVTERQAAVIETSKFTLLDTFSHNGLPVVKAELSRSHEHLFLAYANGDLTCHVLYSGNESISTHIQPKTPPQGPMVSRGKLSRLARNRLSSQRERKQETITSLLTSEDDHFLLCGTDSGQVYVIHVPTGFQLVAITASYKPIRKMLFLTDRRHFQHLVTIDVSGASLHWNIRPLIKQARLLLQPFIIDDDLRIEEELKLDLNRYFAVFEARRNNRIFLNGPDIAAFYTQPPTDLFKGLIELDLAFGVKTDWEISGSIADASDHLIAVLCGSELGDVILTVSDDLRLARWSLNDGSLVWARTLLSQGGEILDIASVYFDQALLFVERSADGQGLTLCVMYTGEGKKNCLTRSSVTGYWVSRDKTQVTLMCDQAGSETTHDAHSIRFHWDLISASEEQLSFDCPALNWADGGTNSQISTTFSPNLSQCVRFLLPRGQTGSCTADTRHFSATGAKRHQFASEETSESVENSTRNSSPRTAETFSRSSKQRPVSDQVMQSSEKSTSPTDESYRMTRTPPLIASHVMNLESHFGAAELGSNTQQSDEEEGVDFAELINLVTVIYWTKFKDGNNFTEEPLRNLKGVNSGDKGLKVEASDSHSAYSRVATPSSSPLQSNDDKGSQRSVSETSDSGVELFHNEIEFSLQLSTACFVNEDKLVVGTVSGHVLLIKSHGLRSFDVYVFLADGSKQCSLDTLDSCLFDTSPPHECALKYVTASDDGTLLVTADCGVVKVWNVHTQGLTMTIKLEQRQKIKYMVVSKDASVIAIATDARTISLWSPINGLELANFMVTFGILDLHLTSDCRKVIVQGVSPENKSVLEIFDVKNIDDVLMHVAGRKRSQQDELREKFKDERQRKVSRQKDARRKVSVVEMV